MTPSELGEYISRYPENQREMVLKEILDVDILGKALESTEGKLIFQGIIDTMTTSISQITNICCNNPPEEAAKQVFPHAYEVNLAYKTLVRWANVLVKGDKHKKTK